MSKTDKFSYALSKLVAFPFKADEAKEEIGTSKECNS